MFALLCREPSVWGELLLSRALVLVLRSCSLLSPWSPAIDVRVSLWGVASLGGSCKLSSTCRGVVIRPRRRVGGLVSGGGRDEIDGCCWRSKGRRALIDQSRDLAVVENGSPGAATSGRRPWGGAAVALRIRGAGNVAGCRCRGMCKCGCLPGGRVCCDWDLTQMNRRGGEDLAPGSAEKESGKRKLGKQHPGGRYSNPSQVIVDRFGAVNVLSTDKFGALRSLEGSGSDVDDNIEEYSTGLYAPLEYNSHSRKRYGCAFGDDSTWRTCGGELEFQGAARSCRSDPSSHSSIPISCTLDLHESRTFTGSDAGPPVKRFCPLIANHCNEQKTQREPNFRSRNEVVDLRRAEHNEFEQGVRAKSLLKPRYSVDPNRIGFLPTAIARLNNIVRNTTLIPAAMESESFASARYSGDSHDQNRLRFNYKFASARLEAYLLERMKARQRVQNETHEPERCSHVISPEDLVWGSVKHYIGMVLDRETNSLLGTAVLFMPPESRQGSQAATVPKSAWVTCVQAVEGRTEVVIKNSRGGMHVAHLMLTSPALGLALFSVNVWQGTFALAFLSRVSGPASLPHRLFVDVDRSDRVYVIGYEEPWESESATIADARVRPGRIVDAGRHTIVEIDFTTGQLGGSIHCPTGFRGGLVVRADGLVAGVVTGELLCRHRTSIDFSSAYNVYALLEEL